MVLSHFSLFFFLDIIFPYLRFTLVFPDSVALFLCLVKAGSTLEHPFAVTLSLCSLGPSHFCSPRREAASAAAGLFGGALCRALALPVLQPLQDCEVCVWEGLSFPNDGLGLSGMLGLRGGCLLPSLLFSAAAESLFNLHVITMWLRGRINFDMYIQLTVQRLFFWLNWTQNFI